jgi:hypothetical protein
MNKSSRFQSKSGHTPAELMVAIVVFSLFVTMVGSSTVLFQKLVNEISQQSEFETSIRRSLNTIGKDVQMSEGVNLYNSQDIRVIRLDGTQVDYFLEKENHSHRLVRAVDNNRQVIMRHVHDLSFRIDGYDTATLIIAVEYGKGTGDYKSERNLEVRYMRRKT